MDSKKMYYVCSNGLCGNKIEITKLFDLDNEDIEYIPTIIQCPICHDEMRLTVIDEEE